MDLKLGDGVSKSRQMIRICHDTDKLSQGPSPDKWVKVVRQDKLDKKCRNPIEHTKYYCQDKILKRRQAGGATQTLTPNGSAV